MNFVLPTIETGSISGTKFEDKDGSNLTTDDRTAGFAGFTIFVDVDGDGTNNQPEFSTVTGTGGVYSIPNVPAGSYTVYEVTQSGYTPVGPTSVPHVVVSVNADTSGVDFANFENIAISGVKFEDHNGNGVQDTGDQPLPGWTIILDDSGNGIVDPGDAPP